MRAKSKRRSIVTRAKLKQARRGAKSRRSKRVKRASTTSEQKPRRSGTGAAHLSRNKNADRLDPRDTQLFVERGEFDGVKLDTQSYDDVAASSEEPKHSGFEEPVSPAKASKPLPEEARERSRRILDQHNPEFPEDRPWYR